MSKNKEYNTGHAEMRERPKTSYKSGNDTSESKSGCKQFNEARKPHQESKKTPIDTQSFTQMPRRVQMSEQRPQRVQTTEQLPQRLHMSEQKPQRVQVSERTSQRVQTSEQRPQKTQITAPKSNKVPSTEQRTQSVQTLEQTSWRIQTTEQKPHRVRTAEQRPRRVQMSEQRPQRVQTTEEKPQRVQTSEQELRRVQTQDGFLETRDTQDVDMKAGYDTKFHPDFTAIERGVYRAAESTMDETDAKKGKNELKRIGRLYGVGSLGRAAARDSFKDSLYGKNYGIGKRSAEDKFNEARIKDIVEKQGGKYRTNESHTLSVSRDYRNNMMEIDKALHARGIDARTYNSNDVRLALKKGIAGKKDRGVILDSETRMLLKEKGRLLELKGKSEQYAKASGGIRNTAKAWVGAAVEDTDTYTGYKVAKQELKLAKTGYKVGKQAIGLTARVGIKTTGVAARGYVNLESKAMRAGNYLKYGNDPIAKARRDGIKDAGLRKTEWIKGKEIKGGQMARNFSANTSFENAKVALKPIGKGVNYAVGVVGRTKVGAKIGKKTSEIKEKISRPFNKFENMQKKVKRTGKRIGKGAKKVGRGFNTVSKVGLAPFKALNFIGRGIDAIKWKLVGCVAFILLSYFIIFAPVVVISSWWVGLPVQAEDETEESKQKKVGEEVTKSISEKTLSYLNYLESGNLTGVSESKFVISELWAKMWTNIPETWEKEREELVKIQEASTATMDAEGQSLETTGESTTEQSAENTTEQNTNTSTTEVETVTYQKIISCSYGTNDTKTIQKIVISCASSGLNEEVSNSTYTSYCMALFDKIMENATFNVAETAGIIDVTVNVASDFNQISSYAAELLTQPEYSCYVDDVNNDGVITTDDFDLDNAKFFVDFTDEEWEEFIGIELFDNVSNGMSDSEIDEFLSGIKYKGSRSELVKGCLMLTNAGIRYDFGGGHTAPAGVFCSFDTVPKQMDCSGFVSFVLAYSGIKPYEYGTTSAYATGTMGGDVTYYAGGITSNLLEENGGPIKIGTIIVKHAHPYTDANPNHVVIYIGNGKIAESTTYNGVSGVQVNPFSKIAGRYHYAVDLIDDAEGTENIVVNPVN